MSDTIKPDSLLSMDEKLSALEGYIDKAADNVDSSFFQSAVSTDIQIRRGLSLMLLAELVELSEGINKAKLIRKWLVERMRQKASDNIQQSDHIEGAIQRMSEILEWLDV